MRYEFSDYEWTAIKPMLPNKPRGVRRVNDRRVLNGIFWILRSGAPWRDLPEDYGARTTCYNRFVRWRQAGVWDRIMDALAAGHDPGVQMIDTSIVRVHQHGACIADKQSPRYGSFTRRPDEQDSRGGGRQSPASPFHAHARRSARQSAVVSASCSFFAQLLSANGNRMREGRGMPRPYEKGNLAGAYGLGCESTQYCLRLLGDDSEQHSSGTIGTAPPLLPSMQRGHVQPERTREGGLRQT